MPDKVAQAETEVCGCPAPGRSRKGHQSITVAGSGAVRCPVLRRALGFSGGVSVCWFCLVWRRRLFRGRFLMRRIRFGLRRVCQACPDGVLIEALLELLEKCAGAVEVP